MNAKKELLVELKNPKDILCATITFGQMWYEPEGKKHLILKLDYTPTELAQFLVYLDFDYDAGYGTQELHGTVWLKDGTWLDRGEYDGSEWWIHQMLPEIPNELKS